MKIKVNRKTVSLFEGATVRHALLRYFALKDQDVSMIEEIVVFDRMGHEIDLDAPASQHETVKFKAKDKL